MNTLPSRSFVCPILVGRAAERAALERVADAARVGRGSTVLIAGDAGVGKSRLVAEVRPAAVQRGFVVVQGRCFEPDHVLPYAPLVDLLRSWLVGTADDRIVETVGAGAAVLAPLLPELAGLIPDQADDQAIEPDQAQRRRALALTRLFTRLAADRPLLVVVEDIHWCDEASLDVLLTLARRAPDHPILLLLTYRSDERSTELAALLAALERERLSHELALAPLTRASVDAVIRAIFDLPHAVPPTLLDAIYAVTEGNPFFVEETLKSLVAAGDLDLTPAAGNRSPLSGLRLPRSVQLAVQRRLDQLGAEARDILTIAAVVGRRFDFALLQLLTGRDEAALIQIMKQLIGAQLVMEESADVFAFRHALTQQAVVADLLTRERRALHRAIADGMEQVYAGALDAHLADLAEHYFAAETWERALVYAQRAGEQAQQLYAPRAAVEQFTRAIVAAERLPHDPPTAIYHARGQCHELLGAFADALDDYEHALEVAHAVGDRQRQWQSLIALGFLWSGRDFTRTGSYFQQALELAEQIGDRATIAHSRNRLGNWHMMVEQPLDALRQHEAARRLFEELHDQRGLAETLDLLGTTNISAGDSLAGIAAYEQAIALFRLLHNRHALASALTMLALCCDQYLAQTHVAADGNRLDVSLQHVAEAIGIVRASGWRSGESLALIVRGQALSAAGSYGPALESIQEGLAIAVEIAHQQWQIDGELMLGALYADLLALPLALQHLSRSVELARAIGSLYWLRTAVGFAASAAIAQGELERAEMLLAEVLQDDTPAVTMGQRHAWCARAELALARHEPAQALAILDALFASAPHVTLGGEHAIPRLALLRAQALAALGHPADAEKALEAAHATAMQRGVRGLEWRILAYHASLAHMHGRRDDAERTRSAALHIVAGLAASLPEGTLRDTFVLGAEAQLRHVPPPTPRRAVKHAYGGLTAREREVATLIAEGLSNRALADALVVSERTIAKHVENILGKLGFSSRAQIAAWAVERGLRSREG